MASFSPMMRFRRDDLPAFGRPMRETNPDFTLLPGVSDLLGLAIFLRGGARDAHLPHAAALGVDHFHVKTVDVEGFADGGDMAEVTQQKAADRLEPFAFD